MNDVETTAESAIDEMAYETIEGQFGNDHSVAIPCQLQFTDTPSKDIEQFHAALDERDFSPLDKHRQDKDGVHYEGEVCSTENYKRIRVLVFRDNVIRIYPREDEPTKQELSKLLKAITTGWDADVEHKPIEEPHHN